MNPKWRRSLSVILTAAMSALLLSPPVSGTLALPEHMVMSAGTVAELPVAAAVRAGVEDGAGVVSGIDVKGGALRLTAGSVGEALVTFRFLGLVPLRTLRLSVEPQRRLVPCGQSVGVALNTQGVVMVGASDLGSTPSPVRLAGLKSGDVIQRVNGKAVESTEALSGLLEGGETVRVEYLRDGVVRQCDVTPALDRRDGKWRLGAWVRSSTAGVGTLTYYDPRSGRFGALGHPITDVDTGVLMPVGQGELYANNVVSVRPSSEGRPGELTGDFFGTEQALGSVTLNSARGIFGKADQAPAGGLYPEGLPIAPYDSVHAGRATLLTTVNGGEVEEYACEIVRLSGGGRSAERSMVVRITDPGLLSRTGGIVQGMSGSPLLQDGKLIGAITHVMVKDPTMGYAIGIEAMLEADDGADNRQAA